MIERGLLIDYVKKVIREPDYKEVTFDDRIKAVKVIEGKTMTVIYYKDGSKGRKNHYVLITAYYL